jgi:hypothetical protein
MLKKIFNFYYEGFKDMSYHSRKLWIIIIIKLVIIFAILKVFFFPDLLNSKFDTDKEKSDHVMEQLINN